MFLLTYLLTRLSLSQNFQRPSATVFLWSHIYLASPWSQHTLFTLRHCGQQSSSLKVTHRSFLHLHLWCHLSTSLRIPHPNYSSPLSDLHLNTLVLLHTAITFHRFYVLLPFLSVLVIPACDRLNWPLLWSTFGRTRNSDWLIDCFEAWWRHNHYDANVSLNKNTEIINIKLLIIHFINVTKLQFIHVLTATDDRSLQIKNSKNKKIYYYNAAHRHTSMCSSLVK